MKIRKSKKVFLLWIGTVFFLFPAGILRGQDPAAPTQKADTSAPAATVGNQDPAEVAKKAEARALVAAAEDHDVMKAVESVEAAAPKTEFDRLKEEWEAVREQQVQMIREKEDQLEKLKEEIFAKMKDQGGADVSDARKEIEAQKAALQADRQKLFAEINRQKESLRQFQLSLDERAKQLELERDRFELEKKAAIR